MEPCCSFAITFSQTSGFADGFMTSSVSSANPAVFSFWLWHVTQYLSNTARGVAAAADRSPSAMADAATRFLAALTPEQKQQAAFAFDAGEREHWGFVPTEMFPRHGLTIGSMTDAQRKLAHDLLKSGLSQKGYLTATSIMELENVLRVIEDAGGGDAAQGRRMERNPVKYFVSIFGTPGARGAWGWRVEGHHVSLNFTVVNGTLVAATPQFFGSNPAEVREGPKKGLRILADEEDSARALL